MNSPAFTKEEHQSIAMTQAKLVRQQYSKTGKQKARSECLAHLRASLCSPGATGWHFLQQSQES